MARPAGTEHQPLLLQHYCAGKRLVALDIEAPGDRAALLRLLATADVVLEGFALGYLASRGLGHADLARSGLDLIVTSVTPYGQDGPYAGFQASDLVATATGGLMHLTGFPDRAPSRPGGNQSLHVAGATAAYASLIALYHRLRTR
ncbi:MAG: CoA transferase [Dehalococcoidia bacterium]